MRRQATIIRMFCAATLSACCWSPLGAQVHVELASDDALPPPVLESVEINQEAIPAPEAPVIDEIVIEPPGDTNDIVPITEEEIDAILAEQEAQIPLPFSFRNRQSQWTWVAAGQYGFGMFSMQDTGYLESDDRSGFNFGLGLHFLKGPIKPDLHPRLWDFTIGYQHRGALGYGIAYDVAFNFGIFSDFEDSARDGVRFPSHAVLAAQALPGVEWLFGIDYLDRDDYELLPVAGMRITAFDGWVINAAIPEPEIQWWYSDAAMIYFAGRLGGGTWDIEYVNAGNDVMNYRQWELVLGSASMDEGKRSSMEFGFLTDRQLEFRSGRPTLELPDVWMFRLVTRY